MSGHCFPSLPRESSLNVIGQKLKARPRERHDWPKVTEWFHNKVTKKWPLCFEILIFFAKGTLVRKCKLTSSQN